MFAEFPGGARHGGERAPAGRERKGGPRKVFAQQNPEVAVRATLRKKFQGALALTSAGARLVPLRAPSRFASQRTQSNRNGQCFKPWGSAHVVTGGSRSLLPGRVVRWVTHRASERPVRAVCGTHGSTSLGRSVARAAELRMARHALDGVLQGEGGGHPNSWGRAGVDDRRGPGRSRARRTPRVWSKTRYRAMRPSYPR